MQTNDGRLLKTIRAICVYFAASGARVRYFTLLRRLAVFNLIIDGDSRVLADFVTRVFQRSRNCEQEKVIGFWQAIPPAIFIRFANLKSHIFFFAAQNC